MESALFYFERQHLKTWGSKYKFCVRLSRLVSQPGV